MSEGYLMRSASMAAALEQASRVYFHKKSLRDIDVRGKRVLVRVDFNVPLDEHGHVMDDSRIRATIPTLNYLRERQARIILMSHLGRPKGVEDRFRLDPVAKRLSELLGTPVKKLDKTVTDDVQAAADTLKAGEVMLLENLRFNPGESENNPDFARKLAGLADVYVNDAFGAAHRQHASVVGVTQFLPCVAGLLLEKEVSILRKLIESPSRPFLAVLGGSKVSDKVSVIDRFLDLVDGILAGGGMCFTFLKAKGLGVGNSLVEAEQLGHAAAMLDKAKRNNVAFYLPVDVKVATEISSQATAKVVPVEQIPDGWIGLDIGPQTIDIYRQALGSARTIFWNGPMGVFEIDAFAQGTRGVAEAIAEATAAGAVSIVGGGDSQAALKKFGLADRMSFVSTGGGASLKILEGAPLPGIEALQDK